MMSHQWWGLCVVFLLTATLSLGSGMIAIDVAKATGNTRAFKPIIKIGIVLLVTFAALAFICAIGGVMTSPPPQEVVR